MLNLEKELNKSQLEAVTYNDGPQLVIAGAGSGKTRVLTYKIAHLMTIGYKPWNILALTFTNKAANEMKERITSLVGPDARYLHMGTFHSIFSRILRAEHNNIPYFSSPDGGVGGGGSQFTIYDETDSRSLIKSIIKELELDDKIYKPATVHKHISWAKNNRELPEDYARNDHYRVRDRDTKMDRMPEIYRIYQQRLQTSNAMDFDDLLLYTYLLFQNNEEIRQKYCQRFQYVLVDEYQDTNAVQQLIVLQLTRDHRHICVVGDDAQSIYGFRGANIDNILDFQNKFSPSQSPLLGENCPDSITSPEERGRDGVLLFKLEQNYRSTQRIVKAAGSLITHNQRQIPKNVFSTNAEGDPLMLKIAVSDREEAIIVCKDILRYKQQENLSFSDFAILYRTNAQSRTFEEEMRRQCIPYRIFGGLSFYQRKEIKDVIAYFRLIVNNNDEEALRRIINYPKRGIGNTTVDKLLDAAHTSGVSPWEIISNPSSFTVSLSSAATAKLHNFTTEIMRFVADAYTVDAYTLGKCIIEDTGIKKEIYGGTDPDDISRQENLQELMSSLQDFVDSREEEGNEHIYLTDFLQEISLLSDLDSDDNEDTSIAKQGEQGRVSAMTIHSAKGLEFPVVFVVGMEDNIFPSPQSADSPRKLEEERRLLYVAITRAERHCILTSAQSRYRYGHMEYDNPSRFLRDIDSRYIRLMSPSASSSDFAGQSGLSRFSRGTSRIQNSSPVATQFKADPKPKITAPRHPEPKVDPFSDSFKHRFAADGGNLRRLSDVTRETPNTQHPTSNTSFAAGERIQHERFGTGTIITIEGTGENTKATVEFQHAGRKQLLLKFARIKKL